MSKKVDWEAWRRDAEHWIHGDNRVGEPPGELTTRDTLALLDSRGTAIKALRDIIAECPQRPTKPFAKRIKTLAQDGLNGSR